MCLRAVVAKPAPNELLSRWLAAALGHCSHCHPRAWHLPWSELLPGAGRTAYRRVSTPLAQTNVPLRLFLSQPEDKARANLRCQSFQLKNSNINSGRGGSVIIHIAHSEVHRALAGAESSQCPSNGTFSPNLSVGLALSYPWVLGKGMGKRDSFQLSYFFEV